MGGYRAGFGYLSGMIVAVGFIPIENAMGGGRCVVTLLTAIFGAIAVAGIYVAFRSTQEKYNTQQLKEAGEVKKALSLASSFKLLFTNRYWLILFAAGLLAQIYSLYPGQWACITPSMSGAT
ncbi:hypothetical protein HH215_18815 [Cohnella herbarum]|uniref:MFS transporter n=1 Tax=Cohnella herbarum TaxID=2728023 RepID=A0A7Z2ZMF7_9BACL|nr:hypothetical protein HH215_18815 [Cohnella herbarum]